MTKSFVSAGIRRNRAVGLVAFALLSWLCASAVVASAISVAGDWTGELVGGKALLRVALHVTADSAGNLNLTLDSLDQNAMGLAGSDVILKSDNFSFSIPSVSGSYSGTLSADGKTLSGTWNQGTPIPLTFTRTSAVASKAAGKASDITGDWSGVLDTSKAGLHLVLHVTADSSGKLSVTLDSPDQHAFGLAGSDAVLNGQSFSFSIPSVSGNYTGTLSADGKTITGNWTQNGTHPLVFTRLKAAAIAH